MIAKQGELLKEVSEKIVEFYQNSQSDEFEIDELDEEFELAERQFLAAIEQAFIIEREILSKAQQEMDLAIQKNYMTLYIIIGVILIGILLSNRVISKSIISRLNQLLIATKQLSAGNRNINLPPHKDDEIGELSQSFQIMSEKLNSTLDNLETKVNNPS